MRFLLDLDVPENIAYALAALDHDVLKLREVARTTVSDDEVLRLAHQEDNVIITCIRDGFLGLAENMRHGGIIILIRRRSRSRALERAALVELLDRAGEAGIRNNINFA